jgi:hypothetical protein
MKKLYTLSLLIASSVTFAQATDPFLGTVGGALNANGWNTHSGATPGQMAIAAGSLSYSSLPATGNKTQIISGNTEDINLASAAAITGTAYYSAVLNVLNTTGLHPNTAIGDYFLTFSSQTGVTGVTAFQGRLYVRTGSAADTFNIGILNTTGGTVAPTFASTDYAIGTPIFVAVKYDLASNTASLFINPAVGGAEGAATVTNATGTTAAPTQIASIAIREGGNATAGTGNIEIDNVRLGSTWDYVTSATLKTNQNSIAGLQVYPNPVVNGTLFITTDNNETKSVAIYDVLGKLVLKTIVNEQAINVSNLRGGVYIVKITEEGKTATRKLVIK